MKSWKIHDIYVDDGCSGTNFARPRLFKDDCRHCLINIVLVKDLSKLGRNHLKFGYYTDIYFPDSIIQFVSVLDEIDLLNAPSDLAQSRNL